MKRSRLSYRLLGVLGFGIWALSAVYFWVVETFLRRIAAARGFDGESLFGVHLVIGFVMMTIAHEVGHWTAGSAVGWRSMRFRIGPYALVRTSRGWGIRWIKWDLGGAVTFAPTSLTGFLSADFIFTVAGPLASVIFALVCISLARFTSSATVFWLFGRIAEMSCFGVLQLIPFRKGLAMTDGYWLWQLLRGGAELRRRQRYMLENMSYGTDLRPRDWPQSLMQPLLESPIASSDRHDSYLAYKHLMDAGKPEGASLWLGQVLKNPRKTDPPEYALEGAYCAAFHTRYPVLAAKWLASAGKVDVDPWITLRAEAAVAWAEGRGDESRSLALDALRRLEDFPAGGYREYEAARLNAILEASVCVPA